MYPTLFAAAGIAEAAWAFASMLMQCGLFVIGLIAILTLVTQSHKLAVAAVALLIAFTLFFQPWHCFAPFGAEAYEDPDVVAAAEEFRIVGIAWIVTCLLVLVSVVMAFHNPVEPFPGKPSAPSPWEHHGPI